ncbi:MULTISPECIES: ceramide glucosyltransferase [Alphaproteobacteria]|uniref:Ceramide glucosyltransferase n=2 Tax=Alphaproteobacteria TaxID=28211 RepID=A0A512HJP2_9HYPH|nr:MULTISPECIES: ceramide glucosyltransferase [Alphaproteobacteria]GEO85651.1 ceramide glucosyltransferase [Ciceribacter naphthalenivorans]GLR21994.1 ceramide glucosyltransferase [Ciceribacter naphthalenivorans]GLT04850.1 ceramide glucosyltransferase [Sphingomonas psychrolutea]
MTVLFWICALALSVHLLSILIVLAHKKRAEPGAPAKVRPSVTILRPICGLENNLAETLASAFRLDWPNYEIVFCVASPADPAIAVARRVMEAYPDANTRLLVGEDVFSPNPKMNNLIKGWRSAEHDWIVIADSNVRLPRDYLQRLFARWTPGTGLVCAPPVGADPAGFAAELECAWLNSFQARWQLLADAVGLGFAQGKSMLLNRQVMARAGGFERLGEEIAEDAAATHLIRATGLKVRLVTEPFDQPLGHRSLNAVWRRQLRWARLRRTSFPLFFAPELFAGGALPIAALAGLTATGLCSPLTFALYVLAWYGGEMLLSRAFHWHMGRMTPVMMVLRDLVLPALWIVAWFGDGFVWRGNAMSVTREASAKAAATARIRRIVDKTKERAKALATLRH